MLDEEDIGLFDEIERKVACGERTSHVRGLYRQDTEGNAASPEKELMMRLSLADEEENHDEIETLMKQLIQIQKD